MAVRGFGNRANDLLDMVIRGFSNQGADLITPPMASPYFGQETALQQELNRPEVQFSQPNAVTMSTTMPDGRIALASPTREMQMAMQGRPLGASGEREVSRMSAQKFPTAKDGQKIDANRLIPGREFPQGSGVALTPQQAEMAKRKPFRMTAESLAEDAAKAVEAGAAESSDPTVMEGIKNYFGSRENMVRLALAFNSMRLTPDAGLAAALGGELKELTKTKTSQMSQAQIVNYLQANGYPELAQVAAQNANMAKTIMEQVLQKELKPAASNKPFSPIQDPDSGQLSIPVYDPETDSTKLIPIPGAITETPVAEAQRKTEETIRLKDLDEGRKAADSAFERANLYRNDINQLYQALSAAEDPNTQTGFLQRYLPAFTSSTAALREAGNRLGLGVVSSVTFGALSASELDLALKTGLDLSLPRPELIKEIERRIGAQEKLYEEMMKDAELLASGIGKKEYIRIIAERRKRNKQIANKFSDLQQKVPNFTKGAWRQLNADQQKRLLESNGIVVEFVQ